MAYAAPATAVATQQAQQSALVSLLEGPVAAAWEYIDLSDPSTMTAFISAITALTQQFGRVSGAEAAKAYMAERKAAGVVAPFRARPAAPADPQKVDASIRWATKSLWQPNPDLQTIESQVLGVVEKNVLDTGRETVLLAVKSDARAKGWARETEPGACSFCAMLATRGAVYHFDRGGFQAHNSCRCFAIPVFNAFEPTAQVREWQQIYKESTKGVHGSLAMRKAFRNAYNAKYPQ
jgi:hypothetical protein